VKASYTDDGGTAESKTSDATSQITGLVQPIQIRNIQTITESAASADIQGADYTSGSTETLIKFDLWFDAENINTLSDNGTASEIRGGQLNFDWTASQLEFIGINVIDAETTAYIHSPDGDTRIVGSTGFLTVNFTSGVFAITNDGTAMVDTDTSNDSGLPSAVVPLDLYLGTIYVNPVDSETDIIISLTEIVITTDDGEVSPLSYTVDIL
jgi:hypothetical protein